MKRLLPYLKGYEKETVLAPLFKLLEALMELMVPLLVARIINEGISEKSMSQVALNFALMLLLAILGMSFSFTSQWFSAKASVGFATALRQALFDHIQSLTYKELDTVGTDTLITRMTSDVNQVQSGVNMGLRLLLRSPFIVFGAMIMAFTINVKCALIFLVAIPVLSIVVYGIMLISIPLFKKAQKNLDELLGISRENLTGVRVIRAFGKEEDSIKEFDQKNHQLTKSNEFVGRISALMNPMTYVIINIAAVLLIRQGALQVHLGNLLQGDVVALYNYISQITVELIKLATLIVTLNKSMACADRVANVFDIQTDMTYPKEASLHQDRKDSDTVLSFDHVSFTYPNSSESAIEDIDFQVKKGQTVGIIGGTGSGKSTLVNLIPRFYDVTQGSVKIYGKDVREYPEGALVQQIGLVPQKAVLFEGSIRENLLWGNENASDQELWKALKIAQAREIVEGKEDHLDSQVRQNGRNLSGGQRQRLTIARALVGNPQILIMDDSASALDFATDARLRKAISQMEGDITTFIVSQRTVSIMDADLILVLDNGQLVGKGNHEELMNSCPIYEEIYYSQFPEKRGQIANHGKEVLA